jgi:hypothetical protein
MEQFRKHITEKEGQLQEFQKASYSLNAKVEGLESDLDMQKVCLFCVLD